MTVANPQNQNTVELSEKFIKEHLPFAPGEYIKVYILSLMFSVYKKPLVSEIADSLSQRETDVVAALEYWQSKSLLKIRNEKEMWVEIENDSSMHQQRSSKLYTDKPYNDMLQQLFGTHILKVKEFEMIYDWTDVLKLPKEVCIMVIEYSIERKGRNVNIKYMDAVAKSWAEKGIDSVDMAADEIDRYERISSGANRVLGYIGGYGRLPSKPEMELFSKWTEDWGFTLDSILMAIEETSSTTNPSFKYIDTILKNFKEQGATTSRKVSESREAIKKKRDRAKELLSMLDMSISKINLEKIDRFKAMGFSNSALKLAFSEGAKKSKVGLNYIEKILKNWKEQGLTTKPKIAESLAGRKELREPAYEFYRKAGLNKALSDIHYKRYLLWKSENGFEEDMMDEVAKYSSTANNPFQYMSKVFENMKAKGIFTKEEFLKEAKNFGKQDKNKRDYMEREYSPEDFQAKLDDVDDSLENRK